MSKQIITALYRAGDRRYWIALLSCGCKQTVDNQQLKDQQLYVGKRLSCACHGKETAQ